MQGAGLRRASWVIRWSSHRPEGPRPAKAPSRSRRPSGCSNSLRAGIWDGLGLAQPTLPSSSMPGPPMPSAGAATPTASSSRRRRLHRGPRRDDAMRLVIRAAGMPESGIRNRLKRGDILMRGSMCHDSSREARHGAGTVSGEVVPGRRLSPDAANAGLGPRGSVRPGIIDVPASPWQRTTSRVTGRSRHDGCSRPRAVQIP
jgi:hypothetical protein